MTQNPAPTIELDCLGLKCPAPVIRLAREAAALGPAGGFLIIRADDPAFRPDLEAWARSAKATVLEFSEEPGGAARAVVRLGTAGLPLPTAAQTLAAGVSLDVRGEQCPGPVIALAKAVAAHPAGTEILVIADDPAFSLDLRSWLKGGRAELISLDERGEDSRARLRILPSTPATATATASVPATVTSDRCTLLVLHNDHEALLAALLVANGAAAQGMETTLFFTFWGLNLLRGDHPDPTQPRERVGFMQRMMKWLMPKGPTRQKLGQMHFGGIGKGMLSSIMRSQNILGLPELMRSAQELGVGFTACTMSMGVMGITKRDLYPYRNLEFAGVATFVERARTSSISLVF